MFICTYRIKASGWLVEEDDVWRAHQRNGHTEAAPHAAAEVRHELVGRLLQTHQLQRLHLDKCTQKDTHVRLTYKKKKTSKKNFVRKSKTIKQMICSVCVTQIAHQRLTSFKNKQTKANKKHIKKREERRQGST